jgi:tRNA(His) 5'-end guanylyltransferase
MVARLDGRSFTRLTKEIHKFEAPFDERMRNIMSETTVHLMNCGFNVIYGYTQSDEIHCCLRQTLVLLNVNCESIILSWLVKRAQSFPFCLAISLVSIVEFPNYQQLIL